MKCRIEREWTRPWVRVWLYQEEPGRGTMLLRCADASGWAWTREDAPEGTVPEPTLVLPEEALDALLREASGVRPPTDATTRHLDDAIGVRDRLLALVENR